MSNRISTWHKMPLNICCGMFLKKKIYICCGKKNFRYNTSISNTYFGINHFKVFHQKKKKKKKKNSFQSPLKNQYQRSEYPHYKILIYKFWSLTMCHIHIPQTTLLLTKNKQYIFTKSVESDHPLISINIFIITCTVGDNEIGTTFVFNGNLVSDTCS